MSRHVEARALMICLKGIFTLLHHMYTHTHTHSLVRALTGPELAINHPLTLPKPDMN